MSKVISEAYERIKPFIHQTEVHRSRTFNELVGADVYFKCENFQKGGSYKIRGALNAILQLTDEQRKAGIVTHSSGNFAQAVALGGSLLGIENTIVMPENAPKPKVAAVKGYGGKIIFCESTAEAREAAADRVVRETNATFLHPSNMLQVIHGQGTAALELVEQHGAFDQLFCPVGGGGLVAGTILFSQGRNTEVYGVEPFEADDAYRSLQSGKIEGNETTNTIADGLRTTLGDVNFPIIKEGINGIIRVTEAEIVDAMKFVWSRMKLVIEPSSANTVAGVLKSPNIVRGKKVGIIVSGGNVDMNELPW